MTLIRVILVAILVISPLVSSATAVAAEKNIYTGKEGAACHVVKGDNKGKSGTYDSAGDCAGDFGATVCKDLNGKPNGFCADGAKIGGGKGNTHELLTDLLLDQVRLFTDQNKILANLSSLKTIVDGIRTNLSDLTATLGPNLFCTLPDLTPAPPVAGDDPRDPTTFCRTDEKFNLIVQVKNQAGVPAGPSTTRVTFNTTPVVVRNLDTPALGGFGGFVNLSTPIPTDCGLVSGTCNFHITVDAVGAVAEINEDNNDADGSCVRLQ